jgi:uncharacterized protein YdaU (DUF1376 family)
MEWRETFQDFFHNGWKHKRIEAELAKMMRISEARAIAGQKGGIGSALSRMKLEGAALSKHVPRQTIAHQLSSKAAANVNHSHSHKINNNSSDTLSGKDGLARKGSSLSASSELLAILGKK